MGREGHRTGSEAEAWVKYTAAFALAHAVAAATE